MKDKTLRTLETGLTPQSSDLFLTRQGSDTADKKVTFAQVKAAATVNLFNVTTDTLDDITAGTTNKQFTETEKTKLASLNKNESFVIAASDETTAITTGTNKLTFRAPYAATLVGAKLSVTTAPTGAPIIVDVNKNGTSVFSTRPSIAIGAKTSVGGVAPVISVPEIAADDEFTVDFDQVGSVVSGTGVKVTLEWQKA